MAIVVKCICKIRDIKTNKIIAYTIEDESGQQETVKADMLKIKRKHQKFKRENQKIARWLTDVIRSQMKIQCL